MEEAASDFQTPIFLLGGSNPDDVANGGGGNTWGCVPGDVASGSWLVMG